VGGHRPVLLAETLETLAVRPGGFYVDGTVGQGGHAEAILARSAPGGRLLAADRDPLALAAAAGRLAAQGERVRFLHADFRELPAQLGEQQADGILLDLGLSSAQLDDPARGFSFRADGPLDMRLDQGGGPTAAELVKRLSERELADVLFRFGEERASRRIARAIVAARRQAPLRTTAELAAVVRRAAGRGRPGHDPATRSFQALRILTNRELEGLGSALEGLAGRLAPGGRMAVIAFHSLEDRAVKETFRSLSRAGFRLLQRKPLRPSDAEVRENPRARSARLRGLLREAA
jgi:16S rRNA (cytosine1402-N4)-methyltransferase